MKKLSLLLLLLVTAPAVKVRAQTAEVTQLILNIEKLNELRKILQELKDGYEILSKGYNLIRDLSRGNFNLHKAFLDGLLEVSPTVKGYGRIQDIIRCQLALIAEYRAAWSQLSGSGQFTRTELEYLDTVYSRLTAQSLKNLEALTDVVTAKKLRMSDDERIKAIDQIYEKMLESLVFLRQFNAGTGMLAQQRKKEYQDIQMLKSLHAPQNESYEKR